jgi:nucleoside-diphosphate-sugar epimerase
MLSFRSILFFAVFHSVATALAATPMKVLVTGAAGKTGRLVMQKLNERPAFTPVGVVRTEESKLKLIDEQGFAESMLVVADICDADSIQKACGEDIDAIIICTSATPAPTGEMTPEGRPVFGFPNGQPVQVDWMGQKNQIDAGKASGSVKQIVICSSMGGTNPENPLNKLGLSDDEGSKDGNILLWKRKAEKYLIDSGVSYTIIHPGGLLDEAGGLRELVVGIDDQQLETENRSIPRADVAELLISSLEHESYKNRSFDARSKPEGDGAVTKDFDKLLNDLKGSCDYSLGVIPEDS